METYTKARPFVDNPDFDVQRMAALVGLGQADLDEPLRPLVAQLNQLPYLFTLQCCYGHFVQPGEPDRHTLEPPPARGRVELEYRIAYLALCLRDDDQGRAFLEAFRGLRDVERMLVQVGSADWFWQRQVNSYVIQVSPRKHKRQDTMTLDGKQARKIAQVRVKLWRELAEMVQGLPAG